MPYDIEGWVEVTCCHGAEQEEDYAWQGVIDLSPISGQGAVPEVLFGLSKRCTATAEMPGALAPRRGIPANPSQRVRADLEAIRRHEEQYGLGEIGGYTHATWQEIKGALDKHPDLEVDEWKCIFDMVRQLEGSAMFRYSADQIRFVVWYNW